MSDTTISLGALGVLLRGVQTDVSAMSVKLDLLTRGRERDLAQFASHDDLRDVAACIAQLADFDLRISGAVGQVAEMLAEQGRRLDGIEQTLADRLPED